MHYSFKIYHSFSWISSQVYIRKTVLRSNYFVKCIIQNKLFMVQERFGYVWTWVKIISTFSFLSKSFQKISPWSFIFFLSKINFSLLNFYRANGFKVIGADWTVRLKITKNQFSTNNFVLGCFAYITFYPPLLKTLFWDKTENYYTACHCRHVIHVSILTNTWKSWKWSFIKLK